MARTRAATRPNPSGGRGVAPARRDRGATGRTYRTDWRTGANPYATGRASRETAASAAELRDVAAGLGRDALAAAVAGGYLAAALRAGMTAADFARYLAGLAARPVGLGPSVTGGVRNHSCGKKTLDGRRFWRWEQPGGTLDLNRLHTSAHTYPSPSGFSEATINGWSQAIPDRPFWGNHTLIVGRAVTGNISPGYVWLDYVEQWSVPLGVTPGLAPGRIPRVQPEDDPDPEPVPVPKINPIRRLRDILNPHPSGLPSREYPPGPAPRPAPNPDRPRRRPPGPGTRERKGYASPSFRNALAQVVSRILNGVTESLDVVEAIYYALPDRYIKGDPTPWEMADAIYRHYREIDIGQAITNLAIAAAVDAASARAARELVRAMRGYSGPRGFEGFGPGI